MTCDFTFLSTVFSHIRTVGSYNERLCAEESHLRLGRFTPAAGLDIGTHRRRKV